MASTIVAELDKAIAQLQAHLELLNQSQTSDAVANAGEEVLEEIKKAHRKAIGYRNNVVKLRDLWAAVPSASTSTSTSSATASASASGAANTTEVGPSTAPTRALPCWTAEAKALAIREGRQMMIGNITAGTTKQQIADFFGADKIAYVSSLVSKPGIETHLCYVTLKDAADAQPLMRTYNERLFGEKRISVFQLLPPRDSPPPPADAGDVQGIAVGGKRAVSHRSSLELEEEGEGASRRKRARTQEPEGAVSQAQYGAQAGAEHVQEYEDITPEVTQRLQEQRLARARSTTPGGSQAKRKFGEAVGGLGGVEEEGEDVGVAGAERPVKKARGGRD